MEAACDSPVLDESASDIRQAKRDALPAQAEVWGVLVCELRGSGTCDLPGFGYGLVLHVGFIRAVASAQGHSRSAQASEVPDCKGSEGCRRLTVVNAWELHALQLFF